MKNIIIAATLTLVFSLGLIIAGCSPNYDQIITDSTKAIEKNPDDADAYLARARASEEKGDYDLAIADCAKAIEVNPDDAKAYYFRGYNYRKKGDYDRAIADCTKAIEIDPDDAIAYYFRARAWEEKGNLDKAIKDCGKALEKNRQVWLDAILYKYPAGLWLRVGKDRRYREDLATAEELSEYVDESQVLPD